MRLDFSHETGKRDAKKAKESSPKKGEHTSPSTKLAALFKGRPDRQREASTKAKPAKGDVLIL